MATSFVRSDGGQRRRVDAVTLGGGVGCGRLVRVYAPEHLFVMLFVRKSVEEQLFLDACVIVLRLSGDYDVGPGRWKVEISEETRESLFVDDILSDPCCQVWRYCVEC